MKKIVVKNQKEYDALPKTFDEFTVIEIWSSSDLFIEVSNDAHTSRVEARGSSRVVAWGSSRVVAWDSSSVVARDSSRVEARGSSSVEAFDFAMLAIFSEAVIVLKLKNYAVASLRNCQPEIKEKSDTATVIQTPPIIERSFQEWLDQGYVYADGIAKKLISSKKLGEYEVFTVEEFLDRKESYVVKKGDVFSHGETVEKAIEDFRYKIADRNTERFESWSINEERPVNEIIKAYRAITGACEFGTKQFCESLNLPEKITVVEAVEKTNGQYGNEQFKRFFGVK